MATAIGTGISRAGGAAGRASRNLMIGYMIYFLVLGLIFMFLLLVYIFIVAVGLALGIDISCTTGAGCVSEWTVVVGIDFVGLLDRMMAGILFFIAAPVGIIVLFMSILINPIMDIIFVFLNIAIDLVNSFASVLKQVGVDLAFAKVTWTPADTSKWMPDFVILVNALKGILLTPFNDALGLQTTGSGGVVAFWSWITNK